MWMFTTDGFYSAVQHREDKTLLVIRCRKEATPRLAAGPVRVAPEPGVLRQAHAGADYACRLFVPRLAWA